MVAPCRMTYWWCLDHKSVEGDDGCRAEVRLGPYPSEAAAARALQSVRDREDALTKQDDAWEERGRRS